MKKPKRLKLSKKGKIITICIILLIMISLVYLISSLGYKDEQDFIDKNNFMYMPDTDQYMYMPDANSAIAISEDTVVFLDLNGNGIGFEKNQQTYMCVKKLIIPINCDNSNIISHFIDDKVAKETYEYYNLGEYTPMLSL